MITTYQDIYSYFRKITKRLKEIIAVLYCFFFFSNLASQNIFRFEHMGSDDGLSQNTAFSILFDSKGFMWIGTMNGLNRYDGLEFRIFRSSSENGNNFTNNRVTKLWEDKKGFIWLETYDGYYHFFNPGIEVFTSLPLYEGSEIKNGAMQYFLQYSDDIIILGSASSGLYILKYDKTQNTYKATHLSPDTDPIITDNAIRFIHKDKSGNIWVGTARGLNMITAKEISSDKIAVKHLYGKTEFTAVCETENKLYLGTAGEGIMIIDKTNENAGSVNKKSENGLKSDYISNLYLAHSGGIIVAFRNMGVMMTDHSFTKWETIDFHSKELGSVYEDRTGSIWLTATDFGATKLDPVSMKTKYFELTPAEIRPLTDLERPQFFEDSKGNLWLGLHGSGLALYNRNTDHFDFFRNDPSDPKTISSNFVHCIAEDRTGQLWVGTGQVMGGIEKVILRNPAFDHFVPEKNPKDILDNVARAVLQDRNNNLWVATKAGRLHLYDSNLKQIHTFLSLPGVGNESLRNITYSLFLDNNDYLWIGSKGYGLSVSTKPLSRLNNNYSDISFRRYVFNDKDSNSISNNNIYSICQDKNNNIWIGTYGNGINLIKDPYSARPEFIRINQKNSNISSNLVRNMLADADGNLWVATAFGLNLLAKDNIEHSAYRFRVFLRNIADEKSLVYNDIIHMYQDSKKRLWFGTFGGGADMIEDPYASQVSFKHFGPGLMSGYSIIFGILEDNRGYIWLSTENGLICLDPENNKSEIFNTFNGLGFNNFSENTCYRKNDGSLVFGGNMGIEIIRPWNISSDKHLTHIELTRFMIFNKEVSVLQKDSPLRKSISFSDSITLKHLQSSFSIDFSALDFLDPGNIEYSYKLENFDRNWNNTGNQHRATYTNLQPGKYLFRVKALGSNGTSISDERLLFINLLPPIWKTTPAYILYTILLILTGTLIYNTLARINRYKNELIIEKKINEYKLQFFTNISHEIRTPLTLIIGPLEDMLAGSDITNKKRIQMEIMLKSARRMLHLTNQLLDFRKVQNNKMILRINKLDLVAFTKDIYNSFVPLSDHKGINFNFSSNATTSFIYADPNKLDTIIYNIISNAIKFTASGKKISVIIDEPASENFVDIIVSDEGPGIPQKNLTDLFTRYTILSNEELAGTGIGLSLSYELARLHKGNILVNSVFGKGSTFTIRLLKGDNHFNDTSNYIREDEEPVKLQLKHKQEISDEIDAEETSDTENSDRNMLLVVEDNQEILNYICQSLKSFFICIGAKNGIEGLHLAKTMNPDVVITDIMMPDMDGMEMTRQLKEDFNTSHIPVIMLTSKANLRDQIDGFETGAEAYIVKPFSMEYLKTVAANLISQRAKVFEWLTGNGKSERVRPKVNSKDEEFLVNLVSYIEENLSVDLSINDLADHCNVSRTVFYNKVRGLTSSSPVEFSRNIRLNAARKLLENGYNVTEVAYKTGFADAKYFSRIFRTRFGYSPSKHNNKT